MNCLQIGETPNLNYEFNYDHIEIINLYIHTSIN